MGERMRCGQGMDEMGLGASGGCSGIFFFFFYNDRVLGSWILFSSAIGERSRAWTAPSVGPVFISGAALQHWG